MQIKLDFWFASLVGTIVGRWGKILKKKGRPCQSLALKGCKQLLVRKGKILVNDMLESGFYD